MRAPVCAAEPAAAISFLNLLYTSGELMNLLIWGIEDENYVVNENGEADYPADKDGSTCGYHGNDFAFGNQFLCLPWSGMGGDFRDIALESLENATRSIYCGLSVDTSDHATLVSSIAAVLGEYKGQVTAGMYTEKLYDEFMKKLDSAGIDEYVAIYQNAVAEFVK